MLSSEGSTLSRLILARHTLICRAIELDLQLEVLALVEAAQNATSYSESAAPPEQSVRPTHQQLSAELALLPALIADLDSRLDSAWQRLHSVSP
jgi:hypothetical protein